MIPQVVDIKVHNRQRRGFRLWIPMLPVYLVLSPVVLLIALVLIVACVWYRVNPGRGLVAGWRLMSGLSGVRVEVKQRDSAVLVAIR